MKYSLYNLIRFLPLFCKCQLNSSAPKLISWQAGVWKLDYILLLPTSELFLITTFHGPRRKHGLSIVGEACSQLRCLAIDVLLLRALCLPSRCLAMDLYVTI
jgi:hypothetical protein